MWDQGLVRRIRVKESCIVIHKLPHISGIEIPGQFTDPFRYVPHPLVRIAAREVIRRISETPGLHEVFSEGKMLGVLVVKDDDGAIGYLAGFSGNAGGRSTIEGFVPPIYDLTDPDGTFRKEENTLNALNEKIRQMESDPEFSALKTGLREAEINIEKEISEMKAMMAIAKQERDAIRSETDDPSKLSRLVTESQYHKAQLRRIKERGKSVTSDLLKRISAYESSLIELKRQRAEKSERLQKWIFEQYIITDACGNRESIAEIFAGQGKTPPGGTGECAAPKLLEAARRIGVQPLAMGEFWYGQSPDTAVRTHGHFYPSCTSKCGPLLEYMTKGMSLLKDDNNQTPVILYEDQDILITCKPSGMPSVPGLNGKISLQEYLEARYGVLHSVHRLDMDTSGIMIFARNESSASCLRRQFEDRTIRKTYKARLMSPLAGDPAAPRTLASGDKGSISLPLGPDYDERPRQKVDHAHGKEAVTGYEVTELLPDGRIDVLFYPVTGRTHQLRVHSAHISGLCRPIEGDMLYGGYTVSEGGSNVSRLNLHAYSITFTHPRSKETMTFTSDCHSYSQASQK